MVAGSMLPKMVADFREDLKEIYLRRLGELGWSRSEDLSLHDLAIQYYDLRRRYIPSRPRRVQVSDRVESADQHSEAIKIIAAKVKHGESLTAHLSRGISRAGSLDLMMVDWGIHHLHLSASIEPDGFVTRTGDILFVRLEDDCVYFIDILPHGGGQPPWTDVDIFETIHRNWPELTNEWALRRIIAFPGGGPFSAAERRRMRQRGIQVPITLSDGTVIVPSMGITLAGTSGEALIQYDRDVQFVDGVGRFLGAALGQRFRLIDIEPPFVEIKDKIMGYTLKFKVEPAVRARR
jgi:hypothetical protein